jgi:hypothetical protein
VTLPFVAYCIPDMAELKIVPAGRTRDWTTAMASLCTPVAMANSNGWLILNDVAFEATWNGTNDPDGVRLTCAGRPSAVSNFGFGCLVWFAPILFRLPEGWNLLVRPPANVAKDGAAGLEGVVEADHATCGLSFVWRLTRPDYPVYFDAGEPIAQIVPQRRGELEQFAPEVRDLRSDPELAASHLAWRRQRMRLITEKHGQTITPKDADKGYLRAAVQKRLRLRPFVDRRGEP